MGEKSRARQITEMILLLVLHGIGPNYYQIAAFWERDVRWRDMRQHYNGREYQRRIKKLNPVDYWMICRHKLVEKSFLTFSHTRTGIFLGYAHHTGGFTSGGRPLCSVVDFRNFISSLSPGAICIKGARSTGGKSISILDRDARGTLQDVETGESVTPEAAFTRLGLDEGSGYVIERSIIQHPTLAAFNPSSLNTLRIWAVKKEGQARVISAFLKIGRQGKIVDNSSSGGMVAPIDFASGVVGPIYFYGPARQSFSRHPDHHALVEGEVIPYFEEAKRLVEKALQRLPVFSFTGADVAITPDGPLIVEVNGQPLDTGVAFMDISPREALAS